MRSAWAEAGHSARNCQPSAPWHVGTVVLEGSLGALGGPNGLTVPRLDLVELRRTPGAVAEASSAFGSSFICIFWLGRTAPIVLPIRLIGCAGTSRRRADPPRCLNLRLADALAVE